MAADYGAWVYAVADNIRPEWLEGITGVAAQPVRAVAAAGLAAAVSDVNLDEFGEEPLRRNLEDLEWLERTARAHHAVIEAVARHEPVVPMRLATVCSDEKRVAGLLSAGRDNFAEVLARLTGRTEWGVKIYVAGRDGKAAEPAASGAEGSARSGTAYLRRRRSELAASEDTRRTAAASADAVHDALSRLVPGAQLRAPQSPQLAGHGGQMILNGAYLVDDERSDEFAAAVRDLAGRHPAVRIELTGPWPPYSFAGVDMPEPAS